MNAPGGADTPYTHGHHDSVLRSHRWRTAENSAAYLVPLLEPGMNLLDVGCGPGTITHDLARLVAPGRTVGIDSAQAAIDVARAAVAAETEAEVPVRFEVADITSLDVPDDSFDVVHAHQVLQHLADPVGALREMGRVCRAGGVVAARDADYQAMTWFPLDPDLDDWLDLYRRVARANGGEADAGRHLLDWATQAGLAEVRPSASVWCFAEPDERCWWGDLWAERITESALAQQAIALGMATAGDLRRMADAWRRWASAPTGWFAVLHGEILCRPE
jgi:SAM-dependent methyltransferase